MNRSEKDTIVTNLRQALTLEGGALVLSEFQGLTVEKANDVRNEFRGADCSYRVVKNTLLRRALEGTPLEVIAPLLKGTTAIAYSRTDPVAPAKVAVKCSKDHEFFKIKGGYFEEFLDAARVEELSRMASKDELRAKLLMTMLAAPQNFLRLLTAAPQRLLLVLQSRKRQQENG